MISLNTKTDRERSLEATEFLWDTSTVTEVHHYVLPVLHKWLAPYKRGRLLDLGCGNGALTARMNDMGISCTGTDFSESGIQIARSSFPAAVFFQSAMEQPLPVEQCGLYDVVIAVEVIEHLLLPRQVFDRAKEALKPGGSFIITTPFHGYWKNLALAMVGQYDSHWHPLRDYGHVKFFSLSTLKQLFEEQGFQIESIHRVGRIPAFSRSMMIKGRLLS